ncbi:protein aspartic protease in guard cell 1, partial [Phtheirospermum japonicum]
KKRASTLEVVDRHGPCAQTPVSLPSLAKILANDQLRVKSIQAQVVKPSDSINTNKELVGKSQNHPNKSKDKQQSELPTQSGAPLKSGNYIVTIGLGTPKRNLSLQFDTGSPLTWTQCRPCAGHCYKQKDPIFNPSTSTTYSNISCKSTQCSQLANITRAGCYLNVTCIYGLRYGDSSYTIGFFSRDKLTVTPTDVFRDFLFGCGQNNEGLFGQTAGLLGLSKGPISFLSQTAKKYSQYFSYCLPSDISSTGFLAFGKNNNNNNKTTKDGPPGVPPIFYFIEITAISVGGTQLRINETVFKTAGAIIDSGTVITRLPPAAYKATSKEFKRQMKKLKYKSAPAVSILDTCFHISGHTNITNIPTMSFIFKGNATVDLYPAGIIYVINSSVVCLAFAGNSDPQDFAIFGNTQQRKLEVVYDVAEGRLGFSHNPHCL